MYSAHNQFWFNIDALADSLEDGRESAEAQLNVLEEELRTLSRTERIRIRQNIRAIVAGLSRLEIRLRESDGSVGKGR